MEYGKNSIRGLFRYLLLDLGEERSESGGKQGTQVRLSKEACSPEARKCRLLMEIASTRNAPFYRGRDSSYFEDAIGK